MKTRKVSSNFDDMMKQAAAENDVRERLSILEQAMGKKEIQKSLESDSAKKAFFTKFYATSIITYTKELTDLSKYLYAQVNDPIIDSPETRACVEAFQQLAIFIAQDILQHSSLDERTIAIERWIAILQACLDNNDFQAGKAILMAFEMSPVARLKISLGSVSEPAKRIREYLQKSNMLISLGVTSMVVNARSQSGATVPDMRMYKSKAATAKESAPSEEAYAEVLKTIQEEYVAKFKNKLASNGEFHPTALQTAIRTGPSNFEDVEKKLSADSSKCEPKGNKLEPSDIFKRESTDRIINQHPSPGTLQIFNVGELTKQLKFLESPHLLVSDEKVQAGLNSLAKTFKAKATWSERADLIREAIASYKENPPVLVVLKEIAKHLTVIQKWDKEIFPEKRQAAVETAKASPAETTNSLLSKQEPVIDFSRRNRRGAMEIPKEVVRNVDNAAKLAEPKVPDPTWQKGALSNAAHSTLSGEMKTKDEVAKNQKNASTTDKEDVDPDKVVKTNRDR